jgi:pyruvate formate lyase activating enzyme
LSPAPHTRSLIGNENANVNGTIFDIKRYAIHDGPGIRTTVFFKGCPLSCAWCQNPESRDPAPQVALLANRCIRCGACLEVCPNADDELPIDEVSIDRERCERCGACVEACPSGARSMLGKTISVTQLMLEINKDRLFFDESGGGVTFSGGEPLMQPEFLLACLRACKQRDYHTAIDTCGHTQWPTLSAIATHTDLFLYDLKLMDDARHEQLLGVSNALILENLRNLNKLGSQIWLRLPLIPGINDDEENLAATAKFVRSLNDPPPVHLLPYHRIGSDKYARLGIPYSMSQIEPSTQKHVFDVAERFLARGLDVKIGG